MATRRLVFLNTSSQERYVEIAADGDDWVMGGLRVGLGLSPDQNFIVTSTGQAKARFDDNSLTPSIQIINTQGSAGFGPLVDFQSGIASGGTPITSGRILSVNEQTWTGTVSTQDSALTFSTAISGAIGEAVRITSTKRVGIQTASPSAELDVKGNARLTGNLAGSAASRSITYNETFGPASLDLDTIGASHSLRFHRSSTAGSSTEWYSPGTATVDMVLDSTGKLGIGLGSPSETLTIRSAATNLLCENAAGTDLATLGPATGGGSNAQLLLKNSGTDTIQLRADTVSWFNAGNVGFGTSNPAQARVEIVETAATEGLRVEGSAAAFAMIVTGGASRETHIRQGTVGSGYQATTPPIDGLVIEGSTGIGTVSPGSKVDIRETVDTDSNVLTINNESTAAASGVTTGIRWDNASNQMGRVYAERDTNLFVIQNLQAASIRFRDDVGNDTLNIDDSGNLTLAGNVDFGISPATGPLNIGTGASTTAVNIGKVGALTTVLGTSIFQNSATFQGDVNLGNDIGDQITLTGALTVSTGSVITTTGSGMINLPSTFKISGVNTSVTVTAPALSTVTGGAASNADAYHTHAGLGADQPWTDAGSYLHPTDSSGAEDVVIGSDQAPSFARLTVRGGGGFEIESAGAALMQLTNTTSGGFAGFTLSATQALLRTDSTTPLVFITDSNDQWTIPATSSGFGGEPLLPVVTNNQDIGSPSLRVKSLYAGTSVNVPAVISPVGSDLTICGVEANGGGFPGRNILIRGGEETDVTVTETAATGTVTCISSSLINDSETFTLNDGVSTHDSVVFEFDKDDNYDEDNVQVAIYDGSLAVGSIDVHGFNGSSYFDTTSQFVLEDGVNPAVTFAFDRTDIIGDVAASHVPISIVGGTSFSQIRNSIISAVNNPVPQSGGPAYTLDITASPNADTSIVDLLNDNIGKAGNKPIILQLLPGWTVDGMSGGSDEFSATDVRDAIITAVNNAPYLDITASIESATTVRLNNDSPGTIGNIAITDTVTDVGFITSGMASGGNNVAGPYIGGNIVIRAGDGGSTAVTEEGDGGDLTLRAGNARADQGTGGDATLTGGESLSKSSTAAIGGSVTISAGDVGGSTFAPSTIPQALAATGTLTVSDGTVLEDGDQFVLRDGSNMGVLFEIDKDGSVEVPAPATGSITVTAYTQVFDTQTITINDGINPAVVFEFDNNGAVSPTSRVRVNMTGVTSNTLLRNAIKAAIDNPVPFSGGPAYTLNISTVNNGTTTIDLTNTIDGTHGNIAISNFTNDLSITGMSGGLDGDLALPIIIGTNDVQASGSFRVLTEGNFNDGATITLDDGVNTPTVFEIDKNATGVTPGNVAINISTGFSAQQVRDAAITAINGVGLGLLVTASPGVQADQVALINDSPGKQGNTVINTTGSGWFGVVNFSGGDSFSSETEVRDLFVTAINNSRFALDITASPGLNNIVNLINNNTGAIGNKPILVGPSVIGIVESGMQGGREVGSFQADGASGSIIFGSGIEFSDQKFLDISDGVTTRRLEWDDLWTGPVGAQAGGNVLVKFRSAFPTTTVDEMSDAIISAFSQLTGINIVASPDVTYTAVGKNRIIIDNTLVGSSGNAELNDNMGSSLWERTGMVGGSNADGSSQAVGSITSGTEGQYIEGEEFVLNDGSNPPTTFRFTQTVTGETTFLRKILRSSFPSVSAAMMRDRIKTDINDAPQLNILAFESGKASLDLFNIAPGAFGNTIFTDNVADLSFINAGMVGGRDVGDGRQAAGTILLPSGVDVADTETFTLDDGTNPAVVFEFDNNASVSGGNETITIDPPVVATGQILVNGVGSSYVEGQSFTIADGQGNIVNFEIDRNPFHGTPPTPTQRYIEIDGAHSQTTIRNEIQAEINASTLQITATSGASNQVILTHQVPGSAGTVPITSNVTLLAISGMSGGRDTTSDEVEIRDAILAAINGASSLNITATHNGVSNLYLFNDSVGLAGNQPILETAADADFKITGMEDGKDAITHGQATGQIKITQALVDGETFTIDDGINPAVTFEFDGGGGVAPGNIAIPITTSTFATGTITVGDPDFLTDNQGFYLKDGINPEIFFESNNNVSFNNASFTDLSPYSEHYDATAGSTADDWRDDIIQAINNSLSPHEIVASIDGPGVVRLNHNIAGTVGNVTPTLDTITTSFTQTPMSGGAVSTDSLIDIRDAVISAINGAPSLSVTATILGLDSLVLTNDTQGFTGNSEVSNNVESEDFRIEGMTGGFQQTGEVPATGTITVVDGASLIDGDNFTINDGSSSYTFEYDVIGNGVTVGSTAILVPTGNQARGRIITIAGGFIAEGQGFYVNDGVNPELFFEFDRNGISAFGSPGGNNFIPVAINGIGTDQAAYIATRNAIINAINSPRSFINQPSGPLSPLNITASAGTSDNVIYLINDNTGIVGNLTPTPETVTTSFTVTPMAGGTGSLATVDDIRDLTVTAIRSTAVNILATPLGADQIRLTNTSTGTAGNTTSSESVADSGFVVTDMTGGAESGATFISQGGNLNLLSGSPTTSTEGVGGNVVVIAASGVNGGAGGNITISAGNGQGAGTPGNVTISTGTGGIFDLNAATISLAGLINANTNRITNLGEPLNPDDAATRDYVDSFGLSVVSTNAANFSASFNQIVQITTGGAGITTVDLPTITAASAGQTIIVKRKLGVVFNTQIDEAGGDTIDDASGVTMTASKQSVTLMSDGVNNWNLVAVYP
jgi:hypothetical protein